MDKEPITIKGLEKLKEELVFRKEKKRPEIVSAISEARSHGDLKENAEYHAAKEQQSHNEGRIEEINDLIARANVIDVTKLANEGKVIFGSTVFLVNLDNDEKVNYKVLTSKKAEKKFLEFIEYFKNQELPVFPIKAEDLMKKFNLTEGKKVGEYLKLLEDFWIKNNFSITEKDLERIVKN